VTRTFPKTSRRFVRFDLRDLWISAPFGARKSVTLFWFVGLLDVSFEDPAVGLELASWDRELKLTPLCSNNW
jgi:hypothetical protein